MHGHASGEALGAMTLADERNLVAAVSTVHALREALATIARARRDDGEEPPYFVGIDPWVVQRIRDELGIHPDIPSDSVKLGMSAHLAFSVTALVRTAQGHVIEVDARRPLKRGWTAYDGVSNDGWLSMNHLDAALLLDHEGAR